VKLPALPHVSLSIKALAIASAAVLSGTQMTMPAQAAEPLRIGLAYLSHPGDAGWTFAHDQGVKRMQARFGDRIVVTKVENVPESPDAERVFRDLASKGNKVVFGAAFGHQDYALKVARNFPDTIFVTASGYKRSRNMGNYALRMYQGAYLAGVTAGAVTKTNVLGFVAAVPVPEVIRNINAYTLGARSVNPKVQTKVVWVNAWFDPGREKQAAETLIGQGADVLLQNTDSSAVVATANEKGVYAFGYQASMHKFAPRAHLGAVVAHWGVYYNSAIEQVLAGTWKSEAAWFGMQQKAVDLEDLNAAVVPVRTVQAVATLRQDMQGGRWDVFTGPISDQKGVVKVPAGKALSDAELHGLNWYVQGVDAVLPK
jgi:basic membrane protein A and related proteins